MRIQGNEKWIALLLAVGGGVCLWQGQEISSSYHQFVVASLGTGMLETSVAFAIIGTYLNLHSKREAIDPILKQIGPIIQEHHNSMLNDMWNEFGKGNFGKIIDDYASSNGDPLSLDGDTRRRLSETIRRSKSRHIPTLNNLNIELLELVHLLDWSLGSEVILPALECRMAISRFITASEREAPATDELCEAFLDASILADGTLRALHKISNSNIKFEIKKG